MALPHTLLTLGTAAGLWWAGHALSCSRQALQAEATPGAFGIAGSAYGSLMARLIRDSLHSYWHGGESSAAGHGSDKKDAPAPLPIPGRFARRNVPPPAAAESTSWLEQRVQQLAGLEARRTKRNSTFPLSAAHQSFLNAEADWRLRLAYRLDPGDAVLYEVLHFHLASRVKPPEAAQAAADALAREAVAFSLREQSSLSATLTGAGASINVLNDLLRPGALIRDPEAILRHWTLLDRCLTRYRDLKSAAQSEGWWDQIPSTRQQDLEEHYRLLNRISGMIRPQLPAARLSVEIQHRWEDQPLPLADLRLKNQAGDTLSVTRLAYLLSHAQIRKDDGEWLPLGDWHAFVDVEKERTQFTLPRLPRGKYTALRFDLGLDKKTDRDDPARWAAGHPLNPDLNALHWSWRGGYVFMAVEGRHLQADGQQGGYSYHLAGQDCRGTVEIPVEMDLNNDQKLLLSLDAAGLFNALNPIRIQDATSTHSQNDGGLAAKIAANALRSFRLLGIVPEMQTAAGIERVGAVNIPALLKDRVPAHFPLTVWPEDNEPTAEGVALGRRLFHDTRLSINNTQSCASCHHQAAAFAEPLAVSRGAEGQTGSRNAMPLFNLAWKPGFFWDGRAPTLRDQVLRPIQDPLEMHETLPGVIAKLNADPGYQREFKEVFKRDEIRAEDLALALEQFLLTQISGQSKLDLAHQSQGKLTEQEQLGFQLFFTESDPARGIRGADCFHCHGGAHFTNNQFLNNGLDAEAQLRDMGREKVTQKTADRGKFMVPSLRNVALTAPYMHDGRFQTLEQVIEHYDHGIQRSATLDPNLAKHLGWGGLRLNAAEKAALVAFLKTLTDETFVATAP